jgi:GH15 family glucan-1,4-alpha-glucosidase
MDGGQPARPTGGHDAAGRQPSSPPLGGAAIEDYAIIGDCHTAALVGRSGSIDWLCWPRFDSPACFAALLGTEENGRWRIAPAEPPVSVTRRYRPGTLILETLFETPSGSVAVIDFMAAQSHTVVRIVEGRSGQVAMTFDLALRFEYGSAEPWVTRLDDCNGIQAIAGPDQVVLASDIALHGKAMRTVADFTAEPGRRYRFALTHAASHLPAPIPPMRTSHWKRRKRPGPDGAESAPTAAPIATKSSAPC